MVRQRTGANDERHTPAGSKPGWRQIAVPSEHGGWSLTAEPVVLGLAVVWSVAGLAAGAVALVAFLARTPLRYVLVDRYRDRWLARTRLAAWVLGFELVLACILIVVVVVTATGDLWWLPPALAGPLVAVELWFDMRSRSRRLVPELAGTVGIGSVAAAIVLAGGGTGRLAAGLWLIVSARAVAAVVYARVQVFRAHGRPVGPGSSDWVQVGAVVLAAIAVAVDYLPPASLVTMAAIGGFNAVSLRRPVRPVIRVGVEQTVLGMVLVVATALAIRL